MAIGHADVMQHPQEPPDLFKLQHLICTFAPRERGLWIDEHAESWNHLSEDLGKVIYDCHTFSTGRNHLNLAMKLFFTSLVFLLAGAATAAPTIVAKDAMNLPPGARVLEGPDEVTQKNEISRIVNGTVSDP